MRIDYEKTIHSCSVSFLCGRPPKCHKGHDHRGGITDQKRYSYSRVMGFDVKERYSEVLVKPYFGGMLANRGGVSQNDMLSNKCRSRHQQLALQRELPHSKYMTCTTACIFWYREILRTHLAATPLFILCPSDASTHDLHLLTVFDNYWDNAHSMAGKLALPVKSGMHSWLSWLLLSGISGKNDQCLRPYERVWKKCR